MAETHDAHLPREPGAAQQEHAARLEALLHAATRARSDATPPTLLTVRRPTAPAPAPPPRDAPRRPPRGAIVPREAAQAQALAQARQTLRALIAAYGAAVVWQEVVAPVYVAQTPVPTPAAPAPANALRLSPEELSQVFGITVVEPS
jgi:hypothetical protein